MTSRKLDEVATDIDDASTMADELRTKHQDTHTANKLDELNQALEHASDTLDQIDNSDEKDGKDGSS
jgi:hypothetical protein